MKTLLIIFSLLIVIILSIGTMFIIQKIRLSPPITINNIPSSQTVAPPLQLQPPSSQGPSATLSLITESLIVRSGQQFTVPVRLNTTSEIYVVDLRMQYDTDAFSFITIQPGDYFSNPQEFKKTIQQDTGSILYSIGALSSATGNKTLATVTFQANTGIDKGSIMITDKTLVATKGAQEATVTLPVTTSIQIQQTTP